MTLDVVIGRTEGFVSSVGLKVRDGELKLLQRDLVWMSAKDRNERILDLIRLCAELKQHGVEVHGVEALGALTVKEVHDVDKLKGLR